jgi:hypothetical protein
MKNELRIAACVPGGEWDSAMGWSLCEMISHFHESKIKNPRKVKTFSVEGSILQDVRNLLVKHALAWKPTHLLLIDSDMKLPPDTIVRLLRHNQPIVGLNYVQRHVAAKPNASKAGYGKDNRVPTLSSSTGLQEVDHIGLGCVLIDARVFDYIQAPAFEFHTIKQYDDEGNVTDWHTKGEDVSFFEKCREAGFKVLIDHDVSKCVSHCGQYEYRHELYEAQLNGN